MDAKYQQIFEKNNILKQLTGFGANLGQIQEKWDFF